MFHKKYRSKILCVPHLLIFLGFFIIAGAREQTLWADEIQIANNNEAKSKPAKTKESTDRPFAQLLSLIAQGERDSNVLWNATKDAPFVLSSDSPNASFHFEWSISDPNFEQIKGSGFERAYIRQLMECQGKNNISLRFFGGVFPPMHYLSNDNQINITGIHKYKSSEMKRWGFIFDENHLKNNYDPDFGPKEFAGFLRFDFSSLLSGMMNEVIPSTQWEAVTRSLILSKPNGSRLQVHFRSPSDAIRYGTHMGELRGKSTSGHIVCYRSFQTNSSSRTRLPFLEIKEVETKLKPAMLSEVKEGAIKKSMLEQLWIATTSFRFLSERKVTLGEFAKKHAYEELSLPDRIPMLLVFFTDTESTDSSENSKFYSPEKAEKKHLFALVKQFYDMWYWIATNSLNDGIYPDDPAMLWREMEVTYGPGGTKSLIQLGLKYILNNKSIISDSKLSSSDLKLEFLNQLGHWGFPSCLDNESAWKLRKSIKDNPFHEAILWSRWQWPCEHKHIDACVKASRESEPGSVKERVSIETLIRLNAIPLLLPNLMKRWYRLEIVEASPAERRINLSVLSLQPSGRSYLLDRLKTKDDTIGIQTDVAKILQARAQATLKTKRFDFISKDKCNEILAITELILASTK